MVEEKLTSDAATAEAPAALMGSSGVGMAPVEARDWTFVFLNQPTAGSWPPLLVA